MSKEYITTYIITVDKELIHEYHQHYMKKHPTSKTLPFAKPKTVKLYNKDGSPQLTKGGRHKTKTQSVSKKDYCIDDCIYGAMSLNDILIINDRMTMNQKKEKWGDLGIWIADKFDLNNLNISNSIVEYRIYGETKANRDLDNIAGGIKFLNDGLFVKSKMYVDDNYNHINPLLIVGDYDKNKPRTEIKITTFDDGIKDIYTKLTTHIKNFTNYIN